MHLHDDQRPGEGLVSYHRRKAEGEQPITFSGLVKFFMHENPGIGYCLAVEMARKALGIPEDNRTPKEYARDLRKAGWSIPMITAVVRLKYGIGSNATTSRWLSPHVKKGHDFYNAEYRAKRKKK